MIRHKFNAVQTIRDGIKFQSKKEAARYDQLKLLQYANEIVFFLRQVPFYLPGNVRHAIDFVVFWTDGHVSFEEVKGKDLPMGIAKRKIVESLFPIKIEVI